MGNQALLFKDPDQMIQKFLPHYQYCKTLSDQPLVKTMMCASPQEGHIVAKAFKTGLDGNIENDMRNINEKFDPRKQPNVLITVLREIRNENAKISFIVAYRQYIYQSLQEKLRVNTPNLCTIERKWLIHQLLCGVSQIHQKTDSSSNEIPLVHGDLKPENILVTSYNQVLITDLVRYKPSFVKSDDLKKYNYFFGELSNNQKCYFAPERFTEQPIQTGAQQLEKSMDVFSTGCIVAEILQEGEVLFDLTKLTKYRKGEYNPKQDLMKKIQDERMVDLIMSMIALKPEDRPTIEECLLRLNQQMLPQSYSRIFYQLCSSFVRPQYLFSDMRISLLRKYMPSIWKSCFQNDISAQDVHSKFFEPLERTIFDKLREDDITLHNDLINPENAGFDFITPDDNLEKELFEISQEDRNSIITVVHWIGAFISSCYFPQTRRCALEMLLVIGKESSLDIRLQYILPYVFKMFDDKQPKVVAKAIEVAVMMFENMIDSDIPYTLSSTDYRVFDNYIMPKFNNVQRMYKDVQMVQITYTRYLPTLAKIGSRFTELSVISRLASDGENAAEGAEEEETKAQNVRVANLDQDMENIRKIFSSIIKDTAACQEISISRLMFSGLGSMCDFFGSKVTMDTLIPLLIAVANKKDFLIKLACLQSVKGVGIKVGKNAISQNILTVIVYFLYDAEELVVLSTIKTLTDLLRNGLISRQALSDDYGSRGQGQPQQEFLVDKLLPFLLHPNTHIREATLNFIVTLSDYENVKILSKAEVVCVLRNKLKPYLKDPVTAIQFLMKRSEPQELLDKLRTPLSRNTYENMVKTDQKKLENQSQLKKSDSDNYALNLESIRTVIERTQVKYRSSMQVISEPSRALQRGRQQKYNLYRVIKSQTLKSIANINELDYKEPINISEYNAEDYQKTFFQPCVRISAEESSFKNIGINPRDDQTSKQLSEIDRIMQALCVLPELDQSTVYTRLANQSLPDSGKLQLEKVHGHAAQPTEMPQFHQNLSKTVSIPVDSAKLNRNLGNPNSSFDKFRPQGRLINTLHEHDHPVTSIAVTENQDMFLTASKDDGIVKVWSSQQVQQDVTANSIMSIKSDCNINQVCTMDQSRSFCVAGTQGIVEVYDMERLGQGGNRKISSPNHALPDNFVKTTTLQHQNEGDIMNCMSTQLPATHQELFLYSTQRGSLFLHDIRCKASALEQKGVFTQQRGMVTCLSQGQDPYQILAGSLGGYVCVFDIRFNVISTAYKHNQKYPINSLSIFHPNNEDRGRVQPSFNRSNITSPMAVIAAGGPSYEVSLLNLDTGNIESILTVRENKPANQDGDDSKSQPLQNQNLGMELPSFYRESTVRDLFSGPERQGNNSSLYQRYLMQTRSLVSTQQIKLTQNIDKELLKSFKNRYSLIKQANESKNGCRKVLVPRKNNNLLQGTSTVDYVITGGNDARLRYWSLTDTVNNSYYINTPNNDECSHFQSLMAGGVLCLEERISRVKNFPQIDTNKLKEPKSINERGDEIKMGGTSVYYSILNRMIQEGMNEDPNRDPQKIAHQARQFLTKDKMMDLNSGAANKYQIQIDDKKQGQKITVWNYNGLSEWQHLNGLSMNHRFLKDTYQDRFAGANGSNNQRQSTSDVFVAQPYRNQSSGTGDKTSDSTHEFIFRESQNVSHADAILDMAMIENQETPMLISSSRDNTVKLWM